MRAIRGFDAWVNRGPFTARDLGIFRIICALALLVTQRSFSWMDGFPASLYSPPPGPFQLLAGFPPSGTFTIVGVLLVVTSLMMGLGLATRWMSLAVSLLSMYELGYSYSFGKIDHSIILTIAPAILSFANWGAALSLDALIAARRRPATGTREIRQWPIRVFAMAISFSFATAAISKIRTGWLSPSSQVVKGYVFRYDFTAHNHNAILDFAQSIQSQAAWEVVDWMVVLFEAAMAVAFLSWRLLRFMIAVATLFHLGVIILLGINFEWDVIGYGAFVPWGRIRFPAVLGRIRRPLVVVGLVVLAALAANTGGKMVGGPSISTLPSDFWVIVLGAAVGFGYLVFVGVRLQGRTPFPVGEWVREPQSARPWARIAVLIVVAVMLVSVPLTCYVKVTDAEPYPALFQPDFNAPGPLRGARVHQSTSVASVTFSDGTTTPIDAKQLFHAVNGSLTDQTIEFQFLFRDNPRARAYQTRAWLAKKIDARFAPRIARALTITWITVSYDHISGKVTDREVQGTTVVRLPVS